MQPTITDRSHGMKYRLIYLTILLSSFLTSSAVYADANDTREDGAHVRQEISQEFSVTEEQVSDLWGKNLGYGEIKHVYNMAEQMPGGITDENVNKILDLRQNQKMGWGNIRKELNLKKGIGENVADQNTTSETETPETEPNVKSEKSQKKENARLEKTERKGEKSHHYHDNHSHLSERGSKPG